MANRVTPTEVIKMQQLYAIHGTYAAVGRVVNRSATTVKKFVLMQGVPQALRIAVQNLISQHENNGNSLM